MQGTSPVKTRLIMAIAILAALAAFSLADIGAIRTASPDSYTTLYVAPVSNYGKWITLHDDARTAQSATDLLRPVAVDDSVCHWVEVSKGASKLACIRAKVPIATSAVGTSPVVRVYAGYGVLPSTGIPPTDGSFRVERLDNSSWTAAGLTLTFAASPTTSNAHNDAVYFYSASVLQTPTDLKGANYILVAVETAGACTATAVMAVEGMFLN